MTIWPVPEGGREGELYIEVPTGDYSTVSVGLNPIEGRAQGTSAKIRNRKATVWSHDARARLSDAGQPVHCKLVGAGDRFGDYFSVNCARRQKGG